jgi:hypothetical protein
LGFSIFLGAGGGSTAAGCALAAFLVTFLTAVAGSVAACRTALAGTVLEAFRGAALVGGLSTGSCAGVGVGAGGAAFLVVLGGLVALAVFRAAFFGDGGLGAAGVGAGVRAGASAGIGAGVGAGGWAGVGAGVAVGLGSAGVVGVFRSGFRLCRGAGFSLVAGLVGADGLVGAASAGETNIAGGTARGALRGRTVGGGSADSGPAALDTSVGFAF